MPAADSDYSQDALLVVSISEDRMVAVVDLYEPPEEGGRGLDAMLVQEALDEAGVISGVDYDAIAHAIEKASSGKDIVGTILARGRAPVEPREGYVEVNGDLALPIFPGDVLGAMGEAVHPGMGFTVDGEDLAPHDLSEPPGFTLAEDGWLKRDDATGNIIATNYGLVRVEDNEIRLEPLVHISRDRLSVSASIYPEDLLEEPVTLERMLSVLRANKIKAAPDKAAIAKAINEARIRGQARDEIVIARGTPPQKGKDSVFEPAFSMDMHACTLREDGTADFCEREMVRNVQESELLGTITPAEKGTAGMDVYGKVIPGIDGKPCPVRPGENVLATEDGHEFWSVNKGMIVIADDTIRVTDVVEVNSDVDYETGNIRVDDGSVIIRGTVRQGFAVEAMGNIVVEGSIEGANVEAGGDVVVRGGITMKNIGFVQARGDLYARYVANGRVEAGGSMVVASEIVNSQVQVGDTLSVNKNKGRILGGSITALGGVYVREIGSHMQDNCIIRVGQQPKRDSSLINEKRVLQATITKIDGAVGADDSQVILMRTPPNKRRFVLRLLKARRQAQEKLEEVMLAIATEKQRLRLATCAVIDVENQILPGTVLEMYGKRKELKDGSGSAQVSYDIDRDMILFRSSR